MGVACCPPLLTLKVNLHSRCAAISDYPSRPSSPADRWLYLLIGPLNLLWVGVPRELRLELPRHIATRPRRRRSNRPHTGNHTHTCADAVRTGHSLSTHTIREHSRAREEEGGSREIAQDSDDGVGASVPKLRADGDACFRRFGDLDGSHVLLCLLSPSPHVEG